MENRLLFGRYLFAIAIMAFGIEIFAFGHSLVAFLQLPASTPIVVIYLIGAFFLASGICIAADVRLKLAATLLGIFFLVVYALFHLPKEIMTPKDPAGWTAAFELIGLCGGAFMLIIIQTGKWNNGLDMLIRSGKYLFASMFIVIGIQHILYGAFIATLIPAWIPFPTFWAYFIGVAFFAVALSLILGIRVKLATTLTGIMFLIWVAVLHGPRVAANPGLEAEWTSLFIALGMSGISFIAGSKNLD